MEFEDSHSGSAIRLKYFTNCSLSPQIENFISKYLNFLVKPIGTEEQLFFLLLEQRAIS